MVSETDASPRPVSPRSQLNVLSTTGQQAKKRNFSATRRESHNVNVFDADTFRSQRRRGTDAAGKGRRLCQLRTIIGPAPLVRRALPVCQSEKPRAGRRIG